MMAKSPLYVAPDGSLTEPLPGSPIDLARQGYVQASDKQVQDMELQKKFGTTTEAWKAGLEHAARAMTGGFSTVAERQPFNVPAETIRAREKYNPVASTAGTVAGFALPALATAGASLLPEAAGSAAALTAPSLIARVGGAAAGMFSEEAMPTLLG